MHEALWPSQEVADDFTRAERPAEVKGWMDEVFGGIEIVKTVRYVDASG